ncbi:MAG: hypothetical protein JXA03_05075, partial [Bacteroidales bacterium]|nr:hypothetical protein [Bacteroidales bacterium]
YFSQSRNVLFFPQRRRGAKVFNFLASWRLCVQLQIVYNPVAMFYFSRKDAEAQRFIPGVLAPLRAIIIATFYF